MGTDLQWAMLMVWLCGGLIVLPFVLVFGLLIRRGMQNNSPTGRQRLLHEGQQWLDTRIADLARWDENVLGNLSTHLTYRYTSVACFTARGTVHSIVDKRPQLAFFTLRTGESDNSWAFHTTLLARTTEQRWRVEIRQGYAVIDCDNTHLGWWRFADGALLDPTQQQIGSAIRDAGWLKMVNNWTLPGQVQGYPVLIHGQTVGQICQQAGHWVATKPSWSARMTPAMPIVWLCTPLNDQARQWLMALCVVEAAYWAFNQRYISFNIT